MSLSLYEVSVPALIRGLENLSRQIDKAAAYAQENGLNGDEFVQARLAPDMLSLAGQVQRASDTAKFGGARLSQGQAPSFADEEATLDELKARIAKTVDYLRGVQAKDVDGGDKREIRFKAGQRELQFVADDYVRNYLLPNFYFHLTTAYGLLRHKGVPLGKLDYLGNIQAA
ncbi:DUF1993 domain-containing protein [Luteimonas gilva]|uniref:DUF1993 domain-containing protein n=1 Tax=Luteimonas gilva TaxID=2572684 RepID=A0A4U5K2V8_9GAMM|nr:DUF1993 domain-containing protein [Luteimonas gilva]TKR33309.1 DUF1993 domain-containing protein [Luteimonas gilva]